MELLMYILLLIAVFASIIIGYWLSIITVEESKELLPILLQIKLFMIPAIILFVELYSSLSIISKIILSILVCVVMIVMVIENRRILGLSEKGIFAQNICIAIIICIVLYLSGLLKLMHLIAPTIFVYTLIVSSISAYNILENKKIRIYEKVNAKLKFKMFSDAGSKYFFILIIGIVIFILFEYLIQGVWYSG